MGCECIGLWADWARKHVVAVGTSRDVGAVEVNPLSAGAGNMRCGCRCDGSWAGLAFVVNAWVGLRSLSLDSLLCVWKHSTPFRLLMGCQRVDGFARCSICFYWVALHKVHGNGEEHVRIENLLKSLDVCLDFFAVCANR